MWTVGVRPVEERHATVVEHGDEVGSGGERLDRTGEAGNAMQHLPGEPDAHSSKLDTRQRVEPGNARVAGEPVPIGPGQQELAVPPIGHVGGDQSIGVIGQSHLGAGRHGTDADHGVGHIRLRQPR